ncbi:UDP-glycosyltransferase 91B1 [Linum perenne]
MNTSKNTNLHIAMFPWLAFRHTLPFLELAKFIARRGHNISFISTTRNINRLPNLPPILSSLITFVKLPLSPVKNLPLNAEVTSDWKVNESGYLKRAYDLLQKPLRYIFLASVLPFTSPPVEVGGEEGEDYQKTVEDLMEKLRWILFETTMRYRRFEAEALFKILLVGGGGQEFLKLYRFRRMLRGCGENLSRA